MLQASSLALVLVPIVIIALLLGFWLWMFYDMINNDEIPSQEPAGLRWPPVAKNHWIIFFVILNIFTAGYYYFTVYKEK